jgi:hypothetical protein
MATIGRQFSAGAANDCFPRAMTRPVSGDHLPLAFRFDEFFPDMDFQRREGSAGTRLHDGDHDPFTARGPIDRHKKNKPPGHKTWEISATTTEKSWTCPRTSQQQTASKVSDSKGRFSPNLSRSSM